MMHFEYIEKSLCSIERIHAINFYGKHGEITKAVYRQNTVCACVLDETQLSSFSLSARVSDFGPRLKDGCDGQHRT